MKERDILTVKLFQYIKFKNDNPANISKGET